MQYIYIFFKGVCIFILFSASVCMPVGFLHGLFGAVYVRLWCWKQGRVREAEACREMDVLLARYILEQSEDLINGLNGWCMAGRERVFGETLSQGNAPHQSAWFKILARPKQTQHCEGLALKAQVHCLEVSVSFALTMLFMLPPGLFFFYFFFILWKNEGYIHSTQKACSHAGPKQ